MRLLLYSLIVYVPEIFIVSVERTHDGVFKKIWAWGFFMTRKYNNRMRTFQLDGTNNRMYR